MPPRYSLRYCYIAFIMGCPCNHAAAAALLALLAVTSGVQIVFGQDVALFPGSPSPSDSGNAILLESRSSKGFCTNGSKGTLRVPGQGIKEAKSDQAQVCTLLWLPACHMSHNIE